MNRISTLLLAIVLILFVNGSYAQTTSMIYPSSTTNGPITEIKFKMLNDNWEHLRFKIDLIEINNNVVSSTPTYNWTKHYRPNDFLRGSGSTNDEGIWGDEYLIFTINASANADDEFKINLRIGTVSNTYTFSKFGPLPVELLSFNAFLKANELKFNWATASEENSSHFEIEESSNGSEFKKLGSVNAAGNTSNRQSYHFSATNKAANTVSYYRLKMVDLDDSYIYSKVILVYNGLFKNYALRINNATINAQLNSDEKVSRVVVTNLKGQTLYDNVSTEKVNIPNYSGIVVVSILTDKNVYHIKTLVHE